MVSISIETRIKCLYLAADRVEKGSLDTKEWNSGRTWLGLDSTWERCDDNGTSLSLPEGVDNGALRLSNVFIVPVPCFRVDGLSDGS